MKPYYWTTEAETPAVYHNNRQCSEGKKIKPQHLAESDSRPAGHRHCEAC